MTIVRPRTKWMYVGGEAGFGLVHTIGHIDDKEDCVNAWSDVEQETEDDPGFAWTGSRDLFLRSFKPVGFIDEAGVV